MGTVVSSRLAHHQSNDQGGSPAKQDFAGCIKDILDDSKGNFGLSEMHVMLLRKLLQVSPQEVQTSVLTQEFGISSSELDQLVAAINLVLANCESNSFIGSADQTYFLPRLSGPVVLPSFERCSLFGRSQALEQIARQLIKRCFVTIVGPGGIGKTSVALALAESLNSYFPDGSVVVELAPLADARLLPLALASSLKMPVGGRDVYQDLEAFLQGKRVLVVLDSCEHMLDEAAVAAEALRSAAPHVHVIATSREALRAMGEWQYHLDALSFPVGNALLSAEDALTYPAIRLFFERTREVLPRFQPSDAETEQMVQLCKKLDGIPLALEFAAAMMGVLGLDGLASGLHTRLLESEYRLGNDSRHETLGAMLDWSFKLLSPVERCVLRHLSIFRNGFTLDAAISVLSNAGVRTDVVADKIYSLMEKSLIASTGKDNSIRPRLLDTTRAYAHEQLVAAGELPLLQQLHATYIRVLMLDADRSWESSTRTNWLIQYLPWIDDVRVALDWAFGPMGDASIGIEIASLSLSLAAMAHLGEEFIERAEIALLAQDAKEITCDEMLTLRLRQYRYYGALFKGNAADTKQKKASLLEAASLVERAEQRRFQTGPFVGLWGCTFGEGDYSESLYWASKIAALGTDTGDMAISLIGRRASAQSLHFLGRHQEAKKFVDSAFLDAQRRIPLAYMPSQIEVATALEIVSTRMLWLQGLPSQAYRMGERCLTRAESDDPAALCHALAMALVPLAFWTGNREACGRLIARLGKHAQRYGFDYWYEWSCCYAKVLEEIDHETFELDVIHAKLEDHLPTFCPALLTQRTWRRVELCHVGWCAPEIMRVRAEQILQLNSAGANRRAMVLLYDALQLSRVQGALSWELRIGMSLTRLARRIGHAEVESLQLLKIYDRFTEGHETPDLRQARIMLAEFTGDTDHVT